jgi:hypothetical protein
MPDSLEFLEQRLGEYLSWRIKMTSASDSFLDQCTLSEHEGRQAVRSLAKPATAIGNDFMPREFIVAPASILLRLWLLAHASSPAATVRCA